jgi:plastocyanin
MRKSHAVRAAVIAAAVASACAALASPAAAANASVTVGAGGDDRFTPSAVTINQGETVTWNWADGTHNVESASANFDSGYKSSGTFSHTFNQPGTFSYVCGAHDDMRGSVTVNAAAPGTTPPPASGGPGGGPTPGTGNGSPTVDSAPPTVSRLKARRKMLRFRSSEKARVSVSIRRVRRGRSALVVKRLRGTAKRGANRMRIKGRLARGRYRVVITARDAAGNRSAPKTTRLVVR